MPAVGFGAAARRSAEQALGCLPWPPHSPTCLRLQGSGKTHTLLGDVSNPGERGVVPRAVAALGAGIAAWPEPCAFQVGAGGC